MLQETNAGSIPLPGNILTKALYHIQRRDGASLELDIAKFERMIEATNPQLKGLRNKFVNQHKLEVGLYLMASGATWEAINTMSTLGYSVCAKTVEEYRKQIQKEHVSKIENHFIENKNLFHIYNIDDYHAIHENRRPDTVSTSTANHFATCVAKPVIESYSVQLTSNGVSVHNPEIVEASKICYYANNIVERNEERSMRGLQLVGFREQHLHLKGENKLTKEDLDNDENDIEESIDEVSEEIEEALDTLSKLAAEIYNIEHWSVAPAPDFINT
ncbi:hypothetical protein C2G38_2241095 [Gigaspora rosea]|uniref:Uncharacterized protein n=1 Tax=Gigaspora rosea TaxID=44941 RepID=A0A397VVH1_9GLOM|nr:hypothetical protein C2G38_2241095 [Gigaspora rosea]